MPSTWASDPTAWAGVLGLLAAHVLGAARLRATSAGRRYLPGWRTAVGTAGAVVLVLALVSPLEAMGERRTWAHMAQHLLLLLVVAPAFAIGRVTATLGAAAPRRLRHHARRRVGTSWTRPLLAAGLLAAVWWGWHVPAAYVAALRSPTLHGLEHATMLGAAWLLWAVLVDAARRSAGGVRVLAALVTALHMAAMAALLTFTDDTWLATPSAPPTVDAHLDQVAAGGLLWFPAGTVWVVVGASLFWRWLREDEIDGSAAPPAPRRQPTSDDTTEHAAGHHRRGDGSGVPLA